MYKIYFILILFLSASCSAFMDSEKSETEAEKKTGNLSQKKIEIYIRNAGEKIINSTVYFKPSNYHVRTVNVEYIEDVNRYKATLRLDWSNIFDSFYQEGTLRFDEKGCNADWSINKKSQNIIKLKCESCNIGCVY